MMIAIAGTDVPFAVDSIPAVFGVTREPFLVFASNALALIGAALALRSPG
jgi:tellurite resistance protein TerC